MMGKRFDESFDGMLFFMPERTEQSFWMYNCIIPLDIIFIDGTTITKIHSNCQPCNDKKNCEYCRCLHICSDKKVFKCRKCKNAYYCTRNHQKKHWQIHKNHCR